MSLKSFFKGVWQKWMKTGNNKFFLFSIIILFLAISIFLRLINSSSIILYVGEYLSITETPIFSYILNYFDIFLYTFMIFLIINGLILLITHNNQIINYNFNILNITLFILSIWIISKFLIFEILLIKYPYIWEIREYVSAGTTYLLLNGKNPFGIENMPAYNNPYGMFYSLVVLPFAKIFGNSLQIHRFITAIAILLIMIILYMAVFRITKNHILSFTAPSLFILNQSVWGIFVLCRPDALSVMLMFLALYTVWRYDFSNNSLIISSILCILGFFTKITCIVALICIFAYLFINGQRKKAMMFFISTFLALLFCLAIANIFTNGLYINNVILQYKEWVHPSVSHSLLLALSFSRIYMCLIAICLLYLAISLHEKLIPINKAKFFNLFPYLKRYLNNFWLVSACICFMFLLYIGTCTGGGLWYYPIVIPMFIIIVFQIVTKFVKVENLHMACILLLIFTLLPYCIYTSPLLPSYPSDSTGNWDHIENIIANNKRVYHDLATAFLIDKYNLTMYNTGCGGAGYIYPTNSSIQHQHREDTINYNIKNKRFDVILLNNFGGCSWGHNINPELWSENYYLNESVAVPIQLGRVYNIDVYYKR